MATAEYNCSQGVLYQVLDMAWDNYDAFLVRFTAYKAGYTAATSLAGRALITTAEGLPDEETRGAAAELLRIDLKPLGKKCTDNYQKLKGYIRSSWAENAWKPNFESAGLQYYEKGTHEDWEAVRSINAAMKNFILANAVRLATDLNAQPNMPGTFPTDVNTDGGAFQTKYNAFLSASNTQTATAAKIEANNAAFNAVTQIKFDDAQVIFKNEPETAGLFVFENLQQMIDPQTQGIKGKTLNGTTNIWEPGVTVKLQKTGHPPVIVNTDAVGGFKIIGQEEGDHTLTVEKSGFTIISVPVKIKTGTVSRKSFTLMP